MGTPAPHLASRTKAAAAPAPPAAKPVVVTVLPKPKRVIKPAGTLASKVSSPSPPVPAAPRFASKTTDAKSLPAGQIKVFFHVSTLDEGVSVKKNDMVEASISKDHSGKLRARRVFLVKKAPLTRLICRNPTCCSKGDRHFEDRCPCGGFVPGTR